MSEHTPALSSDADRRELDWWRLQFGLRFGGKMPKVFSATCGARFVLYVRRPDGSEVPWTGKCETCGGDGYYKGPRLGDEPCSACNGTGCTSPPAESPDPMAVPPPRGAVWSYLGREWIFTGSMSAGKCDAVTAEGGMGAFSLACFINGTLVFVRGPAPAHPTREGSARERAWALLRDIYRSETYQHAVDKLTAELARLDGVIADLTKDRDAAVSARNANLVLAGQREAERDAERSRADGHAAEVDRLNKALAEARGQIVNEREAWKKACETSNRYEALAVQWREHYDAAMRREEVSHTNDLVRLAIDRAVTSWGGTGATENIFTAAGFSSAIMKLAGVTGALDGLVVRVILAGRADVEPRPDGCHYRRIATPGKATP